MVAQRNRKAPAEGRLPEDWPQLLRFALLVVGVGGVLLLGAVLRTAPPAESAITPAPTPVARAVDAEETHRPPAPVRPQPHRTTPVREMPVDPLAARVASDLDRLSAGGDGWTAQLAALCDAARVEALIDRFGAETAFHVIPWLHDGRPCFRVCWNRYASRSEAEGARDLPPALRALASRPLPRSIDEVVE